MASYVVRTREADRVVLDTPSRRDFWFGHGFVLDEAPSGKRLDALIDEGRPRFAALGAQRFVVTWEHAYDAPEPLWDYICAPRVSWDREIVLRFAGETPIGDDPVVDVAGDAAWDEAATIAATEYREHADFVRWRFARAREDVEAGRARVVGVRDGERLVAVCGMYRGDESARFFVPVTAPQARGRGYFSACARTLIAWSRADAPREVVIVANELGPVGLYRSLGFVEVSWQHAVIVKV